MRGLSDVAGAVQIGATIVAAPVARRRYNRWGATAAEVMGPMPGDELVSHPRLGYTRAITIDAPPAAVWSWLVQIGQGRGGLYSFDGLENLARCNIHSAARVRPELQHLSVGDLMRLGPEGYPCFRVAIVDPPTTLVLLGADAKPPHSLPSSPDASGAATWQWQLRDMEGGARTRMIVRQRLAFPPSQRVTWHIVEPIAFVMERQMLLGIRRRAESAAHAVRAN